MPRVLNVAEKPTVAKEISHILGGANVSKRFGASKFNPIFEFNYTINGVACEMVVTSVTGHLMNLDFSDQYKGAWSQIDPLELFNAPISKSVAEGKEPVAKNLSNEIRGCQWLVLWLDCDREGENIAYEVISVCTAQRKSLKIFRAKFADVNKTSIVRAINNLGEPNVHESNAVDARMELDFRLGTIFTRFQTLLLFGQFDSIKNQTKYVSFGPCQFPTLGFVVDRYWKNKSFVPEPFWYIQCQVLRGEDLVDLIWDRNRLFDQFVCAVLLERASIVGALTVTDVVSKPSTKFKPTPLTTVQLQQKASRLLKMSAARCMDIAEKLYQRGFLSYPRTETAVFPEGTDFNTLISHQTSHPEWGQYASKLENGEFETPRCGRGDDKAHPPIHPTRSGMGLQGDEARVYEFVARHFLACCSKDAKGETTTANFSMGDEHFHCQGLVIKARNYLDVYPYDKWNAKTIPLFIVGESIVPSLLNMTQGTTTAPQLLTEADLVSLMDKNGIGTDATIAEHINTIQERNYAVVEGGYFKPTTLGEALVAAYNSIQLQVLARADLRASMEKGVTDIAEQRKTKEEVISSSIDVFRRIYQKVKFESAVLVRAVERYYPRTSTSFETSNIFSKCPKCSFNMNCRKSRRNTFFISCGRTGCSQPMLFFPQYWTEVSISSQTCSNCSNSFPNIRPVHLLQIEKTLSNGDRRGFAACIICDESVLEDLRQANSSFSFSRAYFHGQIDDTWTPSSRIQSSSNSSITPITSMPTNRPWRPSNIIPPTFGGTYQVINANDDDPVQADPHASHNSYNGRNPGTRGSSNPPPSSGGSSGRPRNAAGDLICPTCSKPLDLMTSHSKKNPDRQYYTCFPDRHDSSFIWADEIDGAFSSTSSGKQSGKGSKKSTKRPRSAGGKRKKNTDNKTKKQRKSKDDYY